MNPRRTVAWRVVGASVTGSSHLAVGKGCDDAHAILVRPDGVLVFAVADGAGSAAHAAAGAECAAQTAVATVDSMIRKGGWPRSNRWWNGALKAVFTRVRAKLEDLAVTSKTDLSSLSTTLLLCVASRHRLAAGQVGDGAIVIQTSSGDLRTVTQPTNFEYANETVFITSERYEDDAQFVLIDSGVQSVAAFTDGMQSLALTLSTFEPFSPFFDPLFNFVNQTDATDGALVDFLSSRSVNSRTDDDKTLVIASLQ